MLSFLFTHTPLLYLTQSIWRDEAFSLLLAARSPLYFIPKLVFEPPLYYLMLHYWMKLFGTSEIAARSLSLTGFVLANVVVIYWAEKLFKKHWLSWFLPLFFFFNPELLYYAFEIRAYGWYMFFAVTSMFAYLEKKFTLYIWVTVLGIYTHTYMLMVPAIQMLHYFLTHKREARQIRAFTLTALFIAPWITKVIIDLPRLKDSWYFPIDAQTIKSTLGNIFLGYDGTPPDFWKFTERLSIVLIVALCATIASKKERFRNSFFFLMALVPLVTLLGISWFKPVFVNRYVMPSSIALTFIVVFAIELIKNKLVQKGTALAAFIFVLGFNIWYPNRHPKKDMRGTIYEVQALMNPHDVILTDSPLILFETLYYSREPNRVFWYNPKNITFPWYIGEIAFSPSQSINQLPPYPIRAFIIHDDTTFEITYSAPMKKE